MRSKLKQFPEVVAADINRKDQRAYLWAAPTFDQYAALQHALEDAGGAIQMVHPEYLVPKAMFATLGVKGKDPDKIEHLQDGLQKVQGVRSVVIDSDRWFTNEKGLDVGGLVLWADNNPNLELDLVSTAQKAGFILEPNHHAHGENDDDKWSMTNHAFSGLCLLFLTVCFALQMLSPRPPWLIKHGTTLVWLAMFVFLFIRADRTSWPLGKMSWWESFREADTAAHRVGEFLILILAFADYQRIKGKWSINPVVGRWGLLVVGLGGSIMLFTHLHSTLDPVHYAMVWRMNIQHMLMATMALGFTIAKFAWDTWQAPKRGGQYVWLGFLAALGVVLTLYVE